MTGAAAAGPSCDAPSPDGSPPWVRVVIVNYNGGAWLQRAVDALAVQSDHAFAAVVVDNASTDGSAERLVLPDRRFSLIHAGSNLGFAAANNLAARDCPLPFVATLNPDARAAPDWLAALRRAVRRYPDAAMFGSTQIDALDPSRLDGCGDVMSIFGLPWRGGHGHPVTAAPATDGEVFAPCAAAALYRTDAFAAAGGFDESFFCYLEDVDLGFRLRLAGHRCIQVRDAVVYHVGSAISGRTSDFTLFHSYRNRLWLVAKCMPFPLVLLTLPLHVLATLYLLLRTRRLQNTAAALRGLWAGFRGLRIALKARRRVQAGRRAGNVAIARALSWRVADLRSRAIHLRADRS